MPFYTSNTTGFSPTPLPNSGGTAEPTLIAQPYYRQLDSIRFDYVAFIGPATSRGFFVDFRENNRTFASIFAPVTIIDGETAHVQFAQRIAPQSLTIGDDVHIQTALPVGFWIEPNVSVRLRAVNGDASDEWQNVEFVLGPPTKETPKELNG